MSDLHIETRGRGDTHLVLLHGWAMHGGVFAPLADALSGTFTLHAVDLPGHGHSRASRLHLTAAACAQAIVARTPPAVWLGWSMGGLIALHAARHHAHAIQGLVMLCTSPCLVRKPDWKHAVSAEVFDQFAADLDQGFRATLERFLALEALGSDQALAESRQLRSEMLARGEPAVAALREGLDMLKNTDLRAGLAALDMPTAWLAGARDRIVPWQAMQWAAGQCGGTFARIAHAGHAPFIGHADKVAGVLEALAEQAGA